MINRVRQMDCGNCGHHQRCKYRITGSTELVPACVACGAMTWLSLPRIPVQQIEAQVRAERSRAATDSFMAEMFRQYRRMFGEQE